MYVQTLDSGISCTDSVVQESVGNTVNNGSVPSNTYDMNHSTSATMDTVIASCLHNSMHLDSDSSAAEEFEGSETTLTARKSEEKPCIRQE